MEFDEATWKEIFEKTDEDDRLTAELSQKSKAYDYVMTLGDFRGHVTHALKKLREIVVRVRQEQDIGVTLDVLKDFAFYLFSLGSVHLSLECFLYEGATDLGLRPSLHPIIDGWKKSAPVQLLKAYRNRIQHRNYAVPWLKIEARSPHHPAGASWTASFHLRDDEIDKMLEKMEGASRPHCKTFLDAKVRGHADGVMVLLEAYNDALLDLNGELKNAIIRERSTEFENMRELIQRIDAARAWLAGHGIHNPQQPLLDAIESPSRSW